MNVVSHSPALARATRLRLWAEHLARPRRDAQGDPATLIDDVWRPLADRADRAAHGGRAADARPRRLPHVSRRSKRLLGPLQSLLVDG